MYFNKKIIKSFHTVLNIFWYVGTSKVFFWIFFYQDATDFIKVILFIILFIFTETSSTKIKQACL